MQEYDIIGDVHGQFDKLEALLKYLGYRKKNNIYWHSTRQAVFVGDLIDRGPQQLECLHTVRSMIDAGTAQMVMGNHEYNAICWTIPHPCQAGDFLRTRQGNKGNSNYSQHLAFLTAMQGKDALYGDTLSWFKTLPLWLDLGVIRVVHACWSSHYMQQIKSLLTSKQQITDKLLNAAGQEGSPEHIAIETILKGPELKLPHNLSFQDKEGLTRHEIRIKWWDQNARTYPELALPAAGDEYVLADIEADIPVGVVIDDLSTPIFFGHYWMRGTPQLQAPNIACLDYSAAQDGPLVAYRWQGEKDLTNEHFVYLKQ